MTVRQLYTFVLPHHRLCRLRSPRLPLRARIRARRPGQPAVLPCRSPTLRRPHPWLSLRLRHRASSPPVPPPRSCPLLQLQWSLSCWPRPQSLPPARPLRHPRRLPLAACHSGEMSLTRSLLPLPLYLSPPSPRAAALCSSTRLVPMTLRQPHTFVMPHHCRRRSRSPWQPPQARSRAQTSLPPPPLLPVLSSRQSGTAHALPSHPQS